MQHELMCCPHCVYRTTITSVNWCYLPSSAKPRRKIRQLQRRLALSTDPTLADSHDLRLSVRFARNTGESSTMMLHVIIGRICMTVRHRLVFMLTCMLHVYLCYTCICVTPVFVLHLYLCYTCIYVTCVFMLHVYLCYTCIYVTRVFM